MKKLIVPIIAISLIVACELTNTRYTLQGTVTSPTTIITSDGNVWGYDTEYVKGTHVIVTLDNNRTNKIEDDIITSVEVER